MNTTPKYIFLTVIIMLLCGMTANAQNGPDPVRAKMFKQYANSAFKALKAQETVLGINSGQHIMTKEEVSATADLQREFNTYLTNFDKILTYAAEIYAIFYEVDQAVKNIKELKSITVSCPANTLAVAFSKSKNHIYQDVIDNGIQIAADVKQLLPIGKDSDKDAKMTEYERIKCISNIRKSLRSMNYKLRTMSRLLRCTTLMDSWYELKGDYKKPKSMADICSDCQKRWARKANSVRY